MVSNIIPFFRSLAVVKSSTVPGDRTPMGGRTTGTTNLGRKMATLVNAVWALVLSLRLIMGRNSTPRTAKEVFGSAQVGNILGDFLKVRTVPYYRFI